MASKQPKAGPAAGSVRDRQQNIEPTAHSGIDADSDTAGTKFWKLTRRTVKSIVAIVAFVAGIVAVVDYFSPKPTLVRKPNADFHGVLEIGANEIWWAVLNEMGEIQKQDIQAISSTPLKAAQKLTRKLIDDHVLLDTQVHWFAARGMEDEITPSKSDPWRKIDDKQRVNKLLSWFAAGTTSPKIAVIYFGESTTEICGRAKETDTTRLEEVCAKFRSVDSMAQQGRSIDDLERICVEEVALPLRDAESGTPVRTGCPLLIVGGPIERLLQHELAPHRSKELQSPADLNHYVQLSKANYEAASPDEKQAAAANYVTARLIDLVGRLVLKSTSIHAVGDESHAWVQQYVKEYRNLANRQAN